MMMIRLHVSGMTSPSGKCPNCRGEFRWELYSLVPQVQTFTSRTCHATSTELNHPYLLRISNVKKKFRCNSCFPKNARIDSCVCALLNTVILTSPTQASVFIYPPYIDNLFFLFHIYQSLFVLAILAANLWPLVAFEPCVRWTKKTKKTRNFLQLNRHSTNAIPNFPPNLLPTKPLAAWGRCRISRMSAIMF